MKKLVLQVPAMASFMVPIRALTFENHPLVLIYSLTKQIGVKNR